MRNKNGVIVLAGESIEEIEAQLNLIKISLRNGIMSGGGITSPTDEYVTNKLLTDDTPTCEILRAMGL